MRRLRLARRGGSDAVRARRSCSRPSLEMRSAVVCATLIVAAGARCRSSSWTGCPGAFFQPLALVVPAGRAGLAAGRADASRRRCACCCCPRRRSRAASRRWCGGCSGGYERGLARSSGSPRAALAAVGVLALVGRVAVSPFLDASTRCCRRSRTPTCWSSWDGCARHVAAGDGPHHGSGSRGAAATPGVSDVGAQVGRAVLGDQVGRRQLGRDVGQHRPVGRLRQDGRRRSRRVVDGYPGIDHDGDDLLEGADEQVLGSATGRRARPCASSATTSAVLRSKAERGEAGASAGIDGVAERRASTSPPSEPTMEVEVDLAKAQQLRHQARRCPPRGGDPAVGPPGRQPVRGPEGVRRGGVEHARDARTA